MTMRALNPMQSRDRVIERVNAWPEWKRNAFTYRVQVPSTSPEQTVDADQDVCCSTEASGE